MTLVDQTAAMDKPNLESEIPSIDFQGKDVVFTGSLYNMDRSTAYRLVRSRGGNPSVTVTPDCLLIVGEFNGRHQESASSRKCRMARAKNAEGYDAIDFEMQFSDDEIYFAGLLDHWHKKHRESVRNKSEHQSEFYRVQIEEAEEELRTAIQKSANYRQNMNECGVKMDNVAVTNKNVKRSEDPIRGGRPVDEDIAKALRLLANKPDATWEELEKVSHRTRETLKKYGVRTMRSL